MTKDPEDEQTALPDALPATTPRALLEIRDLRIEATIHPADGQPQHIAIVDGVSLTLERGKVLGPIGESGAGKSTIGLSSLAYGRGGVRITHGAVTLSGRDILRRDPRPLRGREVCYVAQSAAAAFNPAQRLMDQVVEATVEHGLRTRVAAEKRARDLFRKLSLPNPDTIGRRYPHQVSGGQLQRIMTAMALCPQPDLIVFDEPTTSLDVTTQIDVLAAIKNVIRDSDVGALYISHDLAVIAQICDSAIVLKDGKLVESGDIRQIIEEPSEEYTKQLLSVRDICHVEKAHDRAPILTINGVTAAYHGGSEVLKDITLSLSASQTLAVVGESGSGKSTLARVITGLMPASSGEISFDGDLLPTTLSERSRDQLRRLQMIYQSPDVALNPRQTVATTIGRPLEFYFNLHGRERNERVAELLDKVGMGDGFAARYPDELSGGQKQRVCIARALAARPSLIICDEVTSALDPLVADEILKLLLHLQEDEKVAYLFITHDLATVKAIADSVAVLHQGKVVRYGAKSDVLTPPFDDYTDLLLRSVPSLQFGWLENVIAGRHMAAAGN